MNPGATGSEPAAMIAYLNAMVRVPSARRDGDDIGRGELALAGDHRHLALARQRGQAAGQALDDALFPAAQLVEIDARRGERQAVSAERRRLVDHLGRVQQRLGGDAADIEAYAAQRRAAVDEHDLLAEIGRAEGGGVAAGTRAEHDDVAFDVGLGRRGRPAGAGAAGTGAAVEGGAAAGAAARVALEGRQQRALAHLVADLDLDFADHAGLGRRHVERRLVALQREDHLFLGHALAGLDMNVDDRHVLEVADIGKPDFTRH